LGGLGPHRGRKRTEKYLISSRHTQATIYFPERRKKRERVLPLYLVELVGAPEYKARRREAAMSLLKGSYDLEKRKEGKKKIALCFNLQSAVRKRR